jgi:hypothetical protein
MADTYTVSDIVAKTGAKERAVLAWADALALIPEGGVYRPGRGVHRHFSWHEIEVAAVLTAVAAFRLPIGVMVQIAAAVRVQLLPAMVGAPGILGRMAEAGEAARRGEAGIYLIVTPGNDAKPSEPYSVTLQWPARRPEDATLPRRKNVGLIVDLGECLKGLTR